MARVARKKSKTGIYHIMLRGIDKRNIFLDDEEWDMFSGIIPSMIERYTCFKIDTVVK